jgi:uncharacterized membrane protein YidH (DUF202 family)
MNEIDKQSSINSKKSSVSMLQLALVRTRFSAENSLMAWVRTCISLVTFGFAIAQFFKYFEGKQEGDQFSRDPRYLGLALIILGCIFLVFAIIEHLQLLRKLKEEGLQTIKNHSLPVLSALALLVISVAALISIITSLYP